MVFLSDVEKAVSRFRRNIKANCRITDRELAKAAGIAVSTIRNRHTGEELHNTTAYELAAWAELDRKEWVLVDEEGNVYERLCGRSGIGNGRRNA